MTIYTPDRSDEGIQAEYSKDLEQQRFREANPPDYFLCPVCLEYVSKKIEGLLTATEYEEMRDWEEQAGQSVPIKTCNYCRKESLKPYTDILYPEKINEIIQMPEPEFRKFLCLCMQGDILYKMTNQNT